MDDAGMATLAAAEERLAGGLVPRRNDRVFQRGEGVYLFDMAGQCYLDFTSAQGIALLGHAHPAIAQAIAAQASTLVSLPSFLYGEARARFLGKLSSLLPAHLQHVYLCNSGAEATEAALKLAHLATGRQGLAAATKGFHGRTLGALALSWTPKSRQPFASWLPSVTHIPYNRPEALPDAVTENTAALFLEVIQGEGGVNIADTGFLQQAQAICRQTGALLVMDEIQTGLGRTGYWFGYEHAGLQPDIVCLAKGLGGGFPLGAVAFSDAVHAHLFPGAHGSTFGGNPLACAAGYAALSAYERLGTVPHAACMGEVLMQSLQERLGHLRIVRDIRGRGLIVGIELRTRAGPFMKSLLETHRVLVLNAGPRILRLLPPLIIEQEHVDKVVDALAAVLEDAS